MSAATESIPLLPTILIPSQHARERQTGAPRTGLRCVHRRGRHISHTKVMAPIAACHWSAHLGISPFHFRIRKAS
jgi:hypothetical protein